MNIQKLLLLILIILTNNAIGRSKNLNSGYLSLQGGSYSIFSINYKTLYSSKTGLVLGTSFGIPISSKFSLYGSISYFQNEGEYIPDNNFAEQENNILKQLIFDAGIEINLFPQNIVGLYMQSGFTIARIDEERKSSDGDFIYQTEGTGNFGIFGAAVLEINLGKSPISIFSEYKYYYSWNPLLEFDNTYHAHKITFGTRLYFSNRWR